MLMVTWNIDTMAAFAETVQGEIQIDLPRKTKRTTVLSI